MNKVLKRAGIMFTILISVLILLLLASYINHQIQLSKEDSLFRKQIGRSIEVNGHLMNVYSEGVGDVTLVFMTGAQCSNSYIFIKRTRHRLEDGRLERISKKFYPTLSRRKNN